MQNNEILAHLRDEGSLYEENGDLSQFVQERLPMKSMLFFKNSGCGSSTKKNKNTNTGYRGTVSMFRYLTLHDHFKHCTGACFFSRGSCNGQLFIGKVHRNVDAFER